MEFIVEHWLSFGAGIFLLCMVLYGHYRGFLRIAVAMSALLISIVAVQLVTPHVTTFLKENTGLQQFAQQTLVNAAGLEPEENDVQDAPLPARQRILIEQMRLPQQMKDALLENNNNEIYQILGVDTFVGYIGAYLADMVLNMVGSIILFVVIYATLRFLMHWLDLIAKLPILSGINQIAGAVLGGIRGLLWLWGGFLVTDLCAHTMWAMAVLEQIQGSLWLTFLYQNNLISWLFSSLLRRLI